MLTRSMLGLISAVTLLGVLPATLLAAPSPAPSAVTGPATVSANTTGSLGYLCSSKAGILTALQAAASNHGSASLNVTIPANLTSSTGLQELAEIAWIYIVTYPLPFIAKALAGDSGNATAINTFYSSSSQLANYTASSVTPNHDTLYNQAFLDLSQGPQIVTVPRFDTPKRYWIVPFLDAYLNFYGAIGSDYNSSAGSYLVVGRNATANATYGNFTSDRIFYSPTDLNYIIGRVLVLNDSDTSTANNFSKQFNITSYYPGDQGGKNSSSEAAVISRAINGSGYGAYQSAVGFLAGFTEQAEQWFNVSATFLETDPPVNGSTAALISNVTSLSQNATNSTDNGIIQLGLQVAKQCILDTNTGLVTNTGWTFHNASGTYTRASGTDYLLRAQDTQKIPAALPATQVIYFYTYTDSTNQTLDASSGLNYTITFDLPLPAQAFWSLTIYNATNLQLFKNPINRYAIGDRVSSAVQKPPSSSKALATIS